MDEVVRDLLLTLIAFTIIVLAGGMIVLFLWIAVLRGRGRLLPLQRLRPGAWQGREVSLVFLFMLFVPGIADGFLQGIGFYQKYYGKDPSSAQKQLWYMMLAFPLIVAGSFLILFTMSHTRPRHLGLTTARWPQNVILGCLAWIPLTLLTLGLYALTRVWIKAKEHPLTILEDQATVPELLLGLGLALVIAPILEELVFRGVLLGWLRRCSLLGHGVVAVATLFVGFIPVIEYLQQTRAKPVELNLGPVIFALLLVAGYLWIVLREWRQRMAWLSRQANLTRAAWESGPPQEAEEAIREGSPPVPVIETADHLSTLLLTPLPGLSENESRKTQRANILAAIYGSSMLFAVFHSSVWPTPIPLFVLGLGLGWLAFRTQSLVSSITVHFLFNSVACLVLGLSVFYGKENGKAETDAFRPSLAGSTSTIVLGSWLPRFK